MIVTPCFVTYHKSDEIDNTINYMTTLLIQIHFCMRDQDQIEKSEKVMRIKIKSNKNFIICKKEDGRLIFYFMGDVTMKIQDSIEQVICPIQTTSHIAFPCKRSYR
jgi:hypothetical protein